MDKPYHLLVVDDEESITEIANFHLEERGFKVTAINDPRRARDLLGKESFDLVMVDYMMPFLSGLEIVKIIREEMKNKSLPILMVTGKHISIGLREQCLALGVVIYPKPFTGIGLFQKVCDLLKVQ